ncbi:FadD3 family acyl-CoA ligase [Aquihabitans sp. G128]|uniref:FadD3 family acyl-CoA ligase n=1 Tax=Aquihabitans sp. G128 TaxID=2849779 RepID=UPI0020B1EB56|nr:FadD3 family acyl-CoA ligase [Aquihabitans sp. G128]
MPWPVAATARRSSTAARWTWTALGREVDRATAAYLAAGVEPGDRVAIWAPNCAEWVVALFGLQCAGAVLVPLNTRYKGAEAADILARSRARVLVTVDGFLGNRYVGMLDGHDLPHLERIVVLRAEGPVAAPAESWEAFLASGEGIAHEAVVERRSSVRPESTADLLFTSGTTGKPKGVICGHGQLLRTVATWANVVGLDDTDRYVAVNPFFHSFGYKAGIIAWLVTGGTLLPVPVFDVPEVMRLIAAERGSMLPGAPTLYQTILNHPDRDQLDSSSLRLAVTGAASVPVSLVEQMRDDLGFDTVITAYGLTEACGFATMCRRSDDATTIATTAGRSMPGIEVQVVDDDGAALAAGEAGEVVVRGYNVMAGYFEDPAATAEAIDADGWLHTGDVGVMDDRGNLRITDRKKDLFICGGFNAYPAEIENLLLDHPHIAQVAVIGVPDERMGEVGAAFVVATTGTTPDPAEIVAWAREHMANFKAPRTVHVIDALPFNAGGKVMKFELRNRIQESTP